MYRIFIVEDDETIAGAIGQGLARWGFEGKICDDFQDVASECAACDPHLVLMDISLPFFNGYHWCREIRKTSNVPILFISSAGEDMNIVMAVNMGGDDFIAKPFGMDVLLAKVQALLRRTYDFSESRTALLQHDGLTLNSAACSANFQGRTIELSKNENKILTILLENQGRVVSRDALMNRLWQTDCFVDENTLSVNVNRLRKTLDAAGVGDLIKTKKGLGYIIE